MNSTRRHGTGRFQSLVTAAILGAAIAGAGVATFTGASLVAQAAGPVQRSVEGKVEEKGGAPVKGAVVYLQDNRSQSVRSAIAGDDGSYRFVQLSPGTDYQVWAQSGSRKSKTKSISSFDSKNDFNFTLTLDK